jgi:hypothetical protein
MLEFGFSGLAYFVTAVTVYPTRRTGTEENTFRAHAPKPYQ